jgi:hypothetical protein
VDSGSHRNQVYADGVDLSAVENASKQTIAFSSEVDSGSREENASRQTLAFSSEVDSGSREENASKQKE